MIIKKIILDNYRIYRGFNEIEFHPTDDRNIFIVSGENGFGKTTFLTSLVWCFYGKLMVDVDEKYKREIYEAGGYRKYASNNLNRIAATNSHNHYAVTVVLSDIHIPSLPCQEVTITRTFNLETGSDNLDILIDGQLNELTKEVGPEIFINDFVLPKEVAKFFFFDAEKIVSIAEMKSIDDKRKLSKAYSEVLGIKKYQDLKTNLEDLRIRFRRTSASDKEKERFKELQKEVKKLTGLVEFNKEQIVNLTEEKASKKRQSEQYQEKLIREGNSLSVDELINLKKLRDDLSDEGKRLRNRMKEFLELAPFAISGEAVMSTRHQMLQEVENNQKSFDPVLVDKKSKSVVNSVTEKSERLKIEKKELNKILKLIQESIKEEFKGGVSKEFKILLDFSEVEKNEFEAIYNNLKYSFSTAFKALVKEEKSNRIAFNKVVRKITNAESKENDLLVQEIRSEKEKIDNRIAEIDARISELNIEIGSCQKEVAIMSKQTSEIAKKIDLDKADVKKDKVAERLIIELDEFIVNLKTEKKSSLEEKIKIGLNQLMHKSNFVNRVEVEVSDDIIDIHLFDKRDEPILKESLSKGEQQLYATSILNGLVEESNIQFPIFIDSPLQKFDKRHSKNIICDFYPKISKQVVLFPLLEKELTQNEYELLLPNVNSAHLISNIDEDSSTLVQIQPRELFNAYRNNEYVHAH